MNKHILPGDLGGKRAFHCQCGRPVFFRNSVCVNCNYALGYQPELATILPLVPGTETGTWQAYNNFGLDAPVYTNCANLNSPVGCNWLVPRFADRDQPIDPSPGGYMPLCASCRLNKTIPNLDDPANGERWRKIEQAKAQLVATLIALKLPVRSRVSDDTQRGLAFNFLQPGVSQKVLTGHEDGVITLNTDEADDDKREAMRERLHEPYRTLLGHLRHEVGHYYWDLLIDNSPWQEPYRELFGDERADYQQAMKDHYERGAPPDWPLRLVSAYASMHPWEDWAETWAHYLHMIDSLDTAISFGLEPARIGLHYLPFTADALYRPDDVDAQGFLDFVNTWGELTGVMNEMSRSMGQPDFYPFILPAAAVAKLQFIHIVLRSTAELVPHEPVIAGLSGPGFSGGLTDETVAVGQDDANMPAPATAPAA